MLVIHSWEQDERDSMVLWGCPLPSGSDNQASCSLSHENNFILSLHYLTSVQAQSMYVTHCTVTLLINEIPPSDKISSHIINAIKLILILIPGTQ